VTDPRRILDLLPKPVAIVDGSMRVIDANRAFASRFGLSRPGVATGGRQAYWDALARVVGRMQPAARHGQFRWTGGESGSRTFDVRVTRVDHDEFLIVADDAAPYVQVEEIQGEIRRDVERVLNHVGPAVMALDERLHVTFYNQAQAALLERAGFASGPVETVGEAVATVFPVFDAPTWEALCAEVREGEVPPRQRVQWPEGCGCWLDVALAPLHGPGEPVAGAVCVSEAVSSGVELRPEGSPAIDRRLHALQEHVSALAGDASLSPGGRASVDAALAILRDLAGGQ
jgi:PAS domain-containing protein